MGDFPKESFDRFVTSSPPEYYDCPQCGTQTHIDNESCPKCKYELWKDMEWKDMPEFTQKEKQPFAKIIIRFENEKDLGEFAEKIGQRLTSKTKSIWYPYKSHFSDSLMRWVDDES